MVLTRVRRASSAPLSLLGLTLCAGTSLGDSLDVTDQNPLISGYGLPGQLPSDLESAHPWSLSTQYAWGNSTIAQTSTRETLVIDAETRELQLTAQHTFDTGYAVRLRLPYRTVSAGSLDDFIDNWHDIFGLPEGARPSFDKDALRLLYRRDGTNLIDSRESSSGIGDVSVELGRDVMDADRHSTAVWLTANLPTGNAREFTGSGSLDISAAVSTELKLSDSWSVFGQLAGTWMDAGDRLPRQQRSWAASATFGITAHASDGLALTLQFDAHTSVFESDDLDFLGEAVMVSVGGTYQFADDWSVALGLTEDIAVESTADVVFLFELKKGW